MFIRLLLKKSALDVTVDGVFVMGPRVVDPVGRCKLKLVDGAKFGNWFVGPYALEEDPLDEMLGYACSGVFIEFGMISPINKRTI